ncbi:MAG TPA: STAS domain-containing protein [Polyangium sp.]|nr:STAS domain-containing protein [Polyangium sp.]
MKQQINISGVDFEWDLDAGLMTIWGQPVVCMWISSTMAGFMGGLQQLVGSERFNLALEKAGLDSVAGEWEAIISKAPTPEIGINFAGNAASTVGLGSWVLVDLDRESKVAHFRATNSWESLYQKAMNVCWGTRSLAGKLAGYCSRLFDAPCRAEQISFIARGDAFDEFIVRVASTTIEAELAKLKPTDELIEALELAKREAEERRVAQERLAKEVEERKAAEAASSELASLLASLEREMLERKRAEDALAIEVEERKSIEETLRENLRLVDQQQQALRVLSTPILTLGEGVLAMPVIGQVDNKRATDMMQSLLDAIVERAATFTILDVTGVDAIDALAVENVMRIVSASSLLGTQCLLSGISPALARTIVEVGSDLSSVATFGTLEAALRYATRANKVKLQATPKVSR